MSGDAVMYEKELAYLNESEKNLDKSLIQNRRTRYSAEEIKELLELYPGIPQEYLAYLQEVGEGSFRSEFCTIFGDPMLVTDFLDDSLHEFLPDDADTTLLQFGVDLDGNPLVFLLENNWTIGTLYHDDLDVDESGQSFREFISALILG
jgi:hypothetical protein